MSDEELRTLSKVTPADASNYLNGNVSTQAIRIWAQQGKCPFCWAIKSPKNYVYVISVEHLIRFKNGTLPVMPVNVDFHYLQPHTKESNISDIEYFIRNGNKIIIPTDEEILAMHKVPIEVAARYIEEESSFIQHGLQQYSLPFGLAVQSPSGRWTYNISPGLLVAYKRGTLQIGYCCKE